MWTRPGSSPRSTRQTSPPSREPTDSRAALLDPVEIPLPVRKLVRFVRDVVIERLDLLPRDRGIEDVTAVVSGIKPQIGILRHIDICKLGAVVHAPDLLNGERDEVEDQARKEAPIQIANVELETGKTIGDRVFGTADDRIARDEISPPVP